MGFEPMILHDLVTQITFKFIHNAVLVYQWGLYFRDFQIFRDFHACELSFHYLMYFFWHNIIGPNYSSERSGAAYKEKF